MMYWIFFICTYITLSQSLARLEPLYNQVINAAGQCGTDGNSYYGCQGILGYSAALNETKPFGLMVYLGITDPKQKVFDNLGQLQKILSDPQYQPAGTTVGFQFGIWFAPLACSSCPLVPRDEDVANGKYDDAIDAMIEAFSDCKNFPLFCQSPIWLRIGYEFNGEWNMYTPDAYKKAFIRITQKLRANPHTNNYVATVWDYSADAISIRLDYTQWYPGDQWVDWWGVNIFSEILGHAGPNNQDILRFLADAAQKRVPVLLGECTPRGYPVENGVQTWNSWFQPYFNLIHNPSYSIKFASYINWNWDESEWKWGDAQVEVNADILSAYNNEMHRKNTDGSFSWLHLGPTNQTLDRINLNGPK